ncbi:MAG: sulfatase [Thermodesulfovibrionia bacterium]|nr:sulfatase [Thermodesulfovibrionia bacterium]
MLSGVKVIRVRKYVKVFFLIIPFFVLFFLRPASGEKTWYPNVVLIVIDTLRYDHLPFYGYRKDTAPFLTEIAYKSVVFDNAFSASSWTAPSTASIFTSLYPFQHGVVTGYMATKHLQKKIPKIKLNRIPEEIKTIPEILRENGFRTYGVVQNINISEKKGFTRGFEMFKQFSYGKESKGEINDQLRKWAETIKTQGKYFLYIHYNDPHIPYHRRNPWYVKENNKKARIISRYDSEINYVDSMIDEMYRLFEWNRNTLLIVMSDHGEEFWDHGQKGHGKTLYSEVTKIPFFIFFPEKDRMHKRIKKNVSSIDILPTIRSYLKIEDKEFEEGVNLMPLIQKEEDDLKSRYLFSYLLRQFPRIFSPDKIRNKIFIERYIIKATMYKNWKYISTKDGRKQLYNLETDPDESDNVYETYRIIADYMALKLALFEENCKKYKQESENIELD